MMLLVVIGIMFAIMAGTRTWTPKLGLDLQGGMTITLNATNKSVPAESLELAKNIIQQRVDGLGVGEASVATQGDRHIVVSAPNVQRDDLVELVGATAELAFRPVLATAPAGATPPPEGQGPGLPTAPPTPEQGDEGVKLSIDQVLAYQPTEADQSAFAAFECDTKTPDRLDAAFFACDDAKTTKFLLAPVAITGKQVASASSGIPQGEFAPVVTLQFKGEDATALAQLTGALAGKQSPQDQFAIVLDGVVQSNASVTNAITGGNAQISGNFTEATAASLANVLKFGSLPLTFEPSQVESVSATLGGEQLRVGLIAGLIGLAIVMAYCFAYYRGLGFVVLGSLLVAALATYASMVLLGSAVGFSLNLPAIAGAIVAIGITADSFVIYFERIRDEIRDGRSLRSAIDTGWVKARPTIVVADLVSLLSAIVLFILAVGGVKGFAFTLGLTTLIDLAVIFFFTHPLMQLLGRTKFFGEGHKLSGLDPTHMGVSRDSLLGRRTRRTTRIAQEA
ncbi:protein translocase subunit SecD [Tessaracoccus antarcticus]|uniref:Protein translocase subunit SecD n=1 Tax=Tessaracoccus antarcticus TaxID=2479848 RepID=A0A3M0G992_9ACTN|nr:protein translocase subunit SecD [Tessaracoccus antarcticus]RMB59022.1 protein translocase subunit SecD [Tessaracoccus antarcticus]